jgi:hypothetical protein
MSEEKQEVEQPKDKDEELEDLARDLDYFEIWMSIRKQL